MQWELKEVEYVERTMNESGVYTVIHRIVKTETHKEYSGERIFVRVDVHITANAEPIQSFTGDGKLAYREQVQRPYARSRLGSLG